MRLPVSVGKMHCEEPSIFGFKALKGITPRDVCTLTPSVTSFFSLAGIPCGIPLIINKAILSKMIQILNVLLFVS